MKLCTYVLQYMYIVEIQYLSVIPNSRGIRHVWSCNEWSESPILALWLAFKVLLCYSHRVKVDDTLPQHTSRLLHSRFAKRIANFSVAVEIYHVYIKDPFIRLSLYPSLYKANFDPSCLYKYRADFDFVWRLLISIWSSCIYKTCK